MEKVEMVVSKIIHKAVVSVKITTQNIGTMGAYGLENGPTILEQWNGRLPKDAPEMTGFYTDIEYDKPELRKYCPTCGRLLPSWR